MSNTPSEGLGIQGRQVDATRHHRRTAFILLCLLLLVGAGVRVFDAWCYRHGLNLDHAVISLMAKHMAEGREFPVDELPFEGSGPIAYFIDRLGKGLPPDGPLGVEIARKGQQIVDTAFASAEAGKTLPLFP